VWVLRNTGLYQNRLCGQNTVPRASISRVPGGFLGAVSSQPEERQVKEDGFFGKER
jgi:hypothetical protein